MDSIARLTGHERAALILQAEQVELGHQAYALGLALRAQGCRGEAKHWLSIAARYHVSGGQEEDDWDGIRPALVPAPSADSRQSAGRRLAPAAQRLLLGVRLRELRQSRGITQTEAARRVQISSAMASRFENGVSVLGADKLEQLLDLYEVHDSRERDRLRDALYAAQERSWWHEYGSITPEWLGRLFDLEQSADLIQTYEARLVPGLLQTPEYARAVLRTGLPLEEEGVIDGRVEQRLKRQQMLDSSHAPRIQAVLDESVLLRQVGGSRVMREQLQRLLLLTKRPNITIQILPFRSGGSLDIGTSVTMLRFAARLLPDIVYTEQLSGTQYLGQGGDRERYRERLYELAAAAELPHEMESIVQEILGEAEALRENQERDPDAAIYNGFMERVAAKAAPPDSTPEILHGLIASCG
ncbi:helix-turn-helix transcriptional regulator [Streptomyces sp. NPDC088190]|uniref:helix-turn-helix domain-containing protein n=1 Tax=unclassified Streptomyces TaxID=2593676 RepID=UPI002E7A4116|nr:helix-turn-helix transcriptional regulator [Streptomyces sp. JV190]MEE1838753.1 helix-turn-helix transcriptional regulator [Streptomyces sp. JV190]